jgi:Major Facilitator Superfamily
MSDATVSARERSTCGAPRSTRVGGARPAALDRSRHRPDRRAHGPARRDDRQRRHPEHSARLKATAAQVEWVVAAYVLGFAAGLITGGRLGDIYGRKRLFVIGVAGFTLASLWCGVAGSPEVLIVALSSKARWPA